MCSDFTFFAPSSSAFTLVVMVASSTCWPTLSELAGAVDALFVWAPATSAKVMQATPAAVLSRGMRFMVSPFLVVSDRGYRKVRAAPRKKPEKGAGAKRAERTLSGTCVGIEPSWQRWPKNLATASCRENGRKMARPSGANRARNFSGSL
ncbi:hypothetical protein PT2222_150008 [Paraburkholderia tropica]